jgi:hypothetical protein
MVRKLQALQRVQISKLADTDVSLGISVRYAATDEKGVKALTIVKIEPGSVVEQMVQLGDIIGLAFPALQPFGSSSNSSSRSQPQNYILPNCEEFRRAMEKCRSCESFSFYVLRKKQTSPFPNVNRASQEPRGAMGIVPESAAGSQGEETTTASSLTVSHKRDGTSDDETVLSEKHRRRGIRRTGALNHVSHLELASLLLRMGQMNPSNCVSSQYNLHHVQISKQRNADVPLGIEIAYAPHGSKLNLTKAVLTIVSIEANSIWRQKVKVGDIIGFVNASDSSVEAGCGPLVMTRVWTPATDVQFRQAVERSRPFEEFTFHVARKKQTTRSGSGSNVEDPSQEPSDEMGIVSESGIGS